MTRVVERGRHDREAAAEGRDVALRVTGRRRNGPAEVFERRGARAVVRAAPAAARDDELVVPLRLRLPAAPGLAGREERQDLVLVAVLVAQLLSHDKRDGHPLVGRGRCDIRRRVGGVVGLEVRP